MKKSVLWIILLVVVIAVGGFVYWQNMNSSSPASTVPTGSSSSTTPIASATYSCDNSHTISAAYYQGPTVQPQPGQPPVPNGSVKLSLDGGPSLTLAQTLSADGARYSDGNPQAAQGQPGGETFVFWNKGNTVLIMRNNAMDLTYTNCATPASTPSSTSTVTYTNSTYDFTFSLPADWQGYVIVTSTWNGTPATTGPEILIRNPKWTKANPYQDIPVMVFTHSEWNAVATTSPTLVVSAAPIPPSKLGENANYVFALPPRYDYAYPNGWQEVESIIQGNPLHAF